MRYLFLFAAALLLAGCSDKNVEFNGTVAGANTGTVIIRNTDDEVTYQADVTGGKFHINKQALPRPGIYKLSYLLGGTLSKKYEIYLEPGSTYTVTANKDSLNLYPDIKSTSKKQIELSGYYALLKAEKARTRANVMALDAKMKQLDNEALTGIERSTLLQDLHNQQLDANVVDMVSLFKAFVKKYLIVNLRHT
jgi:hypothetical protein